MANDNKELDMELLDKIAGGGEQECLDYGREMAEKYGLNFDKVGLMGVIHRMTYEEKCEMYRRATDS